MITLRHHLFFLLFCAGALFVACSRQGNNSNAAVNSNSAAVNVNATKTNPEELGLLINLPFEADDVVWRDNPAKKQLLAVLRFSPEDANRIVAESEKFGAGQADTLSAERWFPDELIAQADIAGDGTLKGTRYPANLFYQEPYTTGKLFRVEGVDYFVLELSGQ